MIILELVGLLLIILLVCDCIRNVFLVWHKKVMELERHRSISWSDYKLVSRF